MTGKAYKRREENDSKKTSKQRKEEIEEYLIGGKEVSKYR